VVNSVPFTLQLKRSERAKIAPRSVTAFDSFVRKC